MGNLFVGDVPLAESPMKDHPLTPMRDTTSCASCRPRRRARSGLVPYRRRGRRAGCHRRGVRSGASRGERFVVVDAITDRDLIEMGAAAADMPLVTGGSGVALGLPQNFVARA